MRTERLCYKVREADECSIVTRQHYKDRETDWLGTVWGRYREIKRNRE